MSEDTQVKQEDDKWTAQGIAYKYLDDTDSGRQLQSDIESALATLRREVFKEAITLVQSVTNENDLDDGGFFEAGFIAARTKSIDVLIEASATEKEGMNG